MGFGLRLKELLKQKKMTIKELSEKTGISINTLYSITKRDTKIPDPQIIKKISEVLQIQEDDLLTFDVIEEDLRKNIEELKCAEEQHRKKLFDICQYLNSIALLQLSQIALDMLKDDMNHSIINEVKIIEQSKNK